MCFLKICAILTLFADDSTISFANESVSLLFAKLNSDLRIIADWLEKTNAMFFSTGKLSAVLSDFSLIIGANAILFTKIVRLLGVLVDDKLKFDCHVSTLCKK